MFASCSPTRYWKTVETVDLERFMGDWYVVAYRPLFLERNAFNALEHYSYNRNKDQVDITYTFNKGGFDGEEKCFPQTGRVVNKETNAHWTVSPLWPLRFNYLVLALDDTYEWTVIGVPSGNYIWLMARDPRLGKERIKEIMSMVDSSGYPAAEYTLVRHSDRGSSEQTLEYCDEE